MTYRDKCNILHRDVVKKLSKLKKAEGDLKTRPDKTSLQAHITNRDECLKNWIESKASYDAFLHHVVTIGKTLDDEMV